jgi:hypothetical protein
LPWGRDVEVVCGELTTDETANERSRGDICARGVEGGALTVDKFGDARELVIRDADGENFRGDGAERLWGASHGGTSVRGGREVLRS